MTSLRMILNGKAAGNDRLRDTVARMRGAGHAPEVLVTRGAEDAARFAADACEQGVDVIIAAGGDGTVNQVVNGIMRAGGNPSTALAILPLGTANDFAASCGIPGEPYDSLLLAATGRAVPIDVGRANGEHFINVATEGFGAQITATTPPELKRRFGAAAYAIMGFLSLLERPRTGRTTFVMPGETITGAFLLGAIGNGRQAGGGFQVAPDALLDDGLLDILLVRDVDLEDVDAVLAELQDPTNTSNRFTLYRREPWLEVSGPNGGQRFLNLDGEPFAGSAATIRFDLLRRCLPLVLPEAAAALLQQSIA